MLVQQVIWHYLIQNKKNVDEILLIQVHFCHYRTKDHILFVVCFLSCCHAGIWLVQIASLFTVASRESSTSNGV